jgi:hypothetical protein
MQRLVRTAAVRDPEVAGAMFRFATQTVPPHTLFAPGLLLRCSRAVAGSSRRSGQTDPAGSPDPEGLE